MTEEGSVKRRSSVSIRSSITLAAFTVEDKESARSISGRLGGHFDSISTAGSLQVGEGSLLLIPEDIPTGAPPLVIWIVPALTCATAYAFYNIFIKKGSASIHPILGGVILQFVAAIMGSVLLSVLMLKEKNTKLQYDSNGIKWSCCAGLAVGIAEMLSFCVSGMGVPVTRSIPIIIGGSVMFGAVLGLLLLGEKLVLHGWSGVFLLVTGIGLVATDQGDHVSEGGAGDTDDESPPLFVWIFPALTCASAYAFYNIFIKKGSASINPILGGVILQYVAAVFGSFLLGGIILSGEGELKFDHWGLLWSCCAGLSVGAAEMLSFCVSGMGVQATQSIPIIIGGSVMFGAVLGLLMLGESMMLQGWFGVALLMTGIALVATDPGEKVVGH